MFPSPWFSAHFEVSYQERAKETPDVEYKSRSLEVFVDLCEKGKYE